ncbi:hypothetical protein EPN42_04680 [bacterium]|nr:MAG: hypothetical protein EPN42_04680 [bacterium]
MSLHDLPFGTITSVMARIAQAQGLPFEGSQRESYHTRCPWHTRPGSKHDSLQIDNVHNGWTCHARCGHGGILHAVIRLAPEIGFDRRSALEWLTREGLIPPAETPTWSAPQERFEIEVQRQCTRDGIVYPSTAAVRNLARRHHLPRAPLEIEPWWEAADPVRNADPLRPDALAATLHNLSLLLFHRPDDSQRVRDAMQAEAPARVFAQAMLDDLLRNPRAPLPPLYFESARAIARAARRLSDGAEPIGTYVDAHAAALSRPHGPSGARTWFDRTGTLPAYRYDAYQYALLHAEQRFGKPWHTVERELHRDASRHERLVAWIDARAGARVS